MVGSEIINSAADLNASALFLYFAQLASFLRQEKQLNPQDKPERSLSLSLSLSMADSFRKSANNQLTSESKKSYPFISTKEPNMSHPLKNQNPPLQMPSFPSQRFKPSLLRRASSVKQSNPTTPNSPIQRHNDDSDKIVLYFTSLRGIRRTYEDCCTVRSILSGFWVPVDERDVSMDSAYRRQLQSILGQKVTILPQVFIRGKHIGGAEEIRMLHEIGELGKLLEGFPVRNPGFACQRCGDKRFILCDNCNGSRKIFIEDGGGGQLRRCSECNELGLVRCDFCSY